MTREYDFPNGVLQRAYQCALHDAKATVQSERTQLLNLILGEPNNMKTPPKKSLEYTKVSNVVRGAMAVASVMRGVSEGHATLERMLEALDNADLCTKLNITFSKKVKDIHHLAGGDLMNLDRGLDDDAASRHACRCLCAACCFPSAALAPLPGMLPNRH